ncbi:MAG: insulinase family protein [Oscillospiraceae bacterium]|nr:insulinase family protein [Candidatus Equicaccousia limihippi]
MEKINIAAGVDLLFVPNDRFKTERISLNFYLPLEKEKIAERALLPHILTGESAAYPDFSALNRKIYSLYSADIDGAAAKMGDLQKINIDCSYLSEAALSTDISGEVLSLLRELVFKPNFSDGVFCPESVEREKRLTCEKIIASFNNKRSYAISKSVALAFSGEAFGELSTGSLEAVQAITSKSLTDAYYDMLKTAYVLIVVVAPKLGDGIKTTIADAFSQIDRKPSRLPESVPLKAEQTVVSATEQAQVKQAKYVMMFAGESPKTDREKAVATVFSDIFGGGTYSLLFSQVREKMNLCYYCAARINARKGYLSVDSGVDAQNLEKAHEGILRQLQKIKSGDFDQSIIDSSKIAMISALKASDDSSAALSGFYSNRFDSLITPEEFAELIGSVTKQDVCEAAQSFNLSHTFTLTGRDCNE